MVYKKKRKAEEEEEYGPEEDYEDDDEEEEDGEGDDEELPSETPRKRGGPAKKKNERYELRYQEETAIIVDTEASGNDKIIVSRTNRQFKDDVLAQMIIEVKKLNDIEEIKKVVGV